MKKIQRRSYFSVLISIAIIIGMGLYLFRFFAYGGDWASMRANPQSFTSGMLDNGRVEDRNGVTLANAVDGVHSYADDPVVRKSCLHVVGDFSGNFGTSALVQFPEKLIGYNFINGTNKLGKKGGTLTLSIDSHLNATALNALNGRRGSVLVSDYTTGEILCMVSSPCYDPSNPPDLSAPGYEGVYLNRCLSSVFTPGSVFKIVTLAAAIDTFPDLRSMTFDCAGSVQVGNDTVKCTGWHGSQTIEQAFSNSCNCAFSQLAQMLGGDKIQKYAKKLGLLDELNINGIKTAPGSFEIAEEGTSNLSWSGIGQYKDLVSPVSMLHLAGAVANEGNAKELSLIKDKKTSETSLLSAETAQQIKNMMEYNVQYAYGTDRFPNLKMCAKTGTAEVGDGTSHAWFVGFLNDGAHPYAFTVVVENGGGGLAAASPVANAVLQEAIK